jgi:hypothetical protein
MIRILYDLRFLLLFLLSYFWTGSIKGDLADRVGVHPSRGTTLDRDPYSDKKSPVTTPTILPTLIFEPKIFFFEK